MIKRGIVSTNSVNKLTMDTLTPLIGEEYPTKNSPWKTVAGIKQGRLGHWVWVMEIYQHGTLGGTTYQDLNRSVIRRVITGTQVHQSLIPDLLETHNVDIAIVDVEPDINWAITLAEEFRGTVFLGDLVETYDTTRPALDDLVMGSIKFCSNRSDCYKIPKPVFMRSVITNAIDKAYDNKPSYRFPDAWRQYDHANLDSDPLKQLTGVSFDPNKGKWSRSVDKKDDLFSAALFAEAAFAVYCQTR